MIALLLQTLLTVYTSSVNAVAYDCIITSSTPHSDVPLWVGETLRVGGPKKPQDECIV